MHEERLERELLAIIEGLVGKQKSDLRDAKDERGILEVSKLETDLM